MLTAPAPSTVDILKLVPEDGLEPSRGQAPKDFKSFVSTKFHHSGAGFI